MSRQLRVSFCPSTVGFVGVESNRKCRIFNREIDFDS